MTISETIGILVGVPIVTHAVIAGLSAFGKRRAKTAEYRLDQPWTREPLLWTAVDEVVAGGGHHEPSGHAAIDAAPAELIGGRASGRY